MNNSSNMLKIAGIIALIYGATSTIASFIVILTLPITICMIIAGVKFLKYADMTTAEVEKHRSAILAWSIFLICVSVLPGVLGLIAWSEIGNQPFTVYNAEANKDSDVFEQEESDIDKLQQICKLKEDGTITEEEFEQLKNKILNK